MAIFLLPQGFSYLLVILDQYLIRVLYLHHFCLQLQSLGLGIPSEFFPLLHFCNVALYFPLPQINQLSPLILPKRAQLLLVFLLRSVKVLSLFVEGLLRLVPVFVVLPSNLFLLFRKFPILCCQFLYFHLLCSQIN